MKNKMEDTLVSFNVAKLAKEKGFKDYSENSYWYDSNHKFKGDNIFNTRNDYPAEPDEYDAPTQSLVQKYLREEYNIDIEVRRSVVSLSYYCLILEDGLPVTSNESNICKTYEEALEKGLYEALKLIK